MIAQLNLPRSQVSAGVISRGEQETMYAVGGYNDLTDFGWTQTVEAYDATKDQWNLVASFPLKRQYPTVAVL